MHPPAGGVSHAEAMRKINDRLAPWARDFFSLRLKTKMRKQEKSFFVQNLTEELKSAKSIILVDFAGITVKAQQDLKKRLKKVGARMLVVKNTLFKRAGKLAKISKETLADTILSGQTALVISDEDPISPLQTLAKFIREFKTPKLKAGIIEGTFQDKETVTKLSQVPNKKVLAGQVLGAMAKPLYGLIGSLNANRQKLVYILNLKVLAQSGKDQEKI